MANHCEHPDFIAGVDVARITETESGPVVAFSAAVKVECAECGEPFVFVGADIGVMPNRPCMNVDGTELRVPLRPQSSDPHFGLGIPGFVARVREADRAVSN